MNKIDKKEFENIKILLVEDDAMSLEEMSFFIKKYVKNLYLAKNGQEGLELFKKHKPDIVISDIQMPIKNGLEMSKEILTIDPSVPIALTTAYSDSSYIMSAIELGIDKYILKPINMREVLAVIQKFVHIKSNENIPSDYKSYIQFILDSNPTFMFIMHSDKIEYANKKFLDLMGHDAVGTLQEQVNNIERLFELDDIESENWLDYLLKNKNESHLVSLKTNLPFKRKFYVSHKEFVSINKSVFVFVETSKDKLNKINSIAQDLLKNDNFESEVIRNLNKIVEISKEVR